MTTRVEKTTYGETYVHQDDGSKVIPESKRPDGTTRKPIRVREGFMPTGETRYDAPGKQVAVPVGAAYPTGYDSSSAALGERRIPGYIPDAADGKPDAKKKSRRRNKGKNAQADEGADEEAAEVAEAAEGGEVAEVAEEFEVKQPEPAQKAEEAPKAKETAAATETSQKAEEEKLMRKAKKKLNDIETLEKRGPPYTPEEEAKVNKKGEFLAEIKYLEKVQKGQTATANAVKSQAATANAAKGKQAAAAASAPKPKQEPSAKPNKVEAPATPEKVSARPAEAAAPAPKIDAAEVEVAQKRLRNVNKKLAEIEKLKNSGKELDADQMAKVARKAELDAEMKHLTKQLGL
jgi:hypothetical protein